MLLTEIEKIVVKPNGKLEFHGRYSGEPIKEEINLHPSNIEIQLIDRSSGLSYTTKEYTLDELVGLLEEDYNI